MTIQITLQSLGLSEPAIQFPCCFSEGLSHLVDSSSCSGNGMGIRFLRAFDHSILSSSYPCQRSRLLVQSSLDLFHDTRDRLYGHNRSTTSGRGVKSPTASESPRLELLNGDLVWYKNESLCSISQFVSWLFNV